MPTDRRQFLVAAVSASVAGIAGCDSSGGQTTSTDESSTKTATDTATPTDQAETNESTTDTASESGLPRLSTDENWVVDENGNEVVLRGVNTVDPWWADEYADIRGNTYAETLELATNHEKAWYPRVIRIPCQPASIEAVGVETFASEYLDPAIEHCREHGVYAIVDYHTIEPYDTDDIDERIRAFWNEVGPRYADQPHVLYELFNEPTEPYGNGLESWENWRETAQPWVDLLREHAPETPIILGSPEWTSLTRFAAESPFEGEDLIYAAHIYPDNGPDTWEETYGTAASDVPVMITEWGYLDVNGNGHDPHMRGTTSGWGEPFREWLDGHENVGWTAWCFDSVWDPQLFTTNWDLLGGEYWAGRFTKQWLYETRNTRVPEELQFETTGTPSPPDDETPPDPPTGLTVESVGTTNAQVSWEATTDGETSVALNTVYVNGEATVRTGDKQTSAAVSGLEPDSENEITVTATDVPGNESDPSEPVTASTGKQSTQATIPRSEAVPTLDGQATDEAWATVTEHELDTVLAEGIEGPEDLAATWKALWNDTGLYVLVEVSDDSLSADSDAAWKNDGVEVYVDGDNSKGTSYDGENDFQFVIPYDSDDVLAGGASPSVGDATHAQRQTPDGWTVEFHAPWSTIGVSPDAGDVIGFDVHVNDDDGGGGRDHKLSWFAESDTAWEDPSLFGNVVLGE